MRKPPDKPCEGCEHAPCRLPLNCAHYLRYQQERRQYWNDTVALRQAKLRKTNDWEPASTRERRQRLAEACPWRQEDDTVGKKAECMETCNKTGAAHHG